MKALAQLFARLLDGSNQMRPWVTRTETFIAGLCDAHTSKALAIGSVVLNLIKNYVFTLLFEFDKMTSRLIGVLGYYFDQISLLILLANIQAVLDY